MEKRLAARRLATCCIADWRSAGGRISHRTADYQPGFALSFAAARTERSGAESAMRQTASLRYGPWAQGTLKTRGSFSSGGKRPECAPI